MIKNAAVAISPIVIVLRNGCREAFREASAPSENPDSESSAEILRGCRSRA